MRRIGVIRCWLTRRDLTALVDGELPPRRRERVFRHVQACESCAALYEEISSNVAQQRTLLRETASAAPQPDVERMLRVVHQRVRELADPAPQRVAWQPLAAGALAMAAVALFVYGRGLKTPPAVAPSAELAADKAQVDGVASAPGPDHEASGASRVRDRSALPADPARVARAPQPSPQERKGIPKGDVEPRVEEVPPELLARPELFVDYGLVVRLDALENFDAVQSLPEREGTEARQSG